MHESDFIRLVGVPNESLRLIMIYYMFKYSFSIKKNFARFTSEPKKPFKGLISSKLVIITLFLHEVSF